MHTHTHTQEYFVQKTHPRSIQLQSAFQSMQKGITVTKKKASKQASNHGNPFSKKKKKRHPPSHQDYKYVSKLKYVLKKRKKREKKTVGPQHKARPVRSSHVARVPQKRERATENDDNITVEKRGKQKSKPPKKITEVHRKKNHRWYVKRQTERASDIQRQRLKSRERDEVSNMWQARQRKGCEKKNVRKKKKTRGLASDMLNL
jgi:hypothetical protein